LDPSQPGHTVLAHICPDRVRDVSR
jgi:hypothetical protein